ncbi:MAG: hypothetical protein ABUS54_06995 [Actinomycetota bacterium]
MQWSAAAVTAAALYALPFTLVGMVTSDEPRWIAAFLANVLLLVATAVWRWSPLVVLAAVILSGVGAVVFLLVTSASDVCGGSHLAGTIEWAGGCALALPVGTWSVRRGAWALAAIPAGWVAGALWFAAVAHAVHGGSGGCLD